MGHSVTSAYDMQNCQFLSGLYCDGSVQLGIVLKGIIFRITSQIKIGGGVKSGECEASDHTY